MNTTIKEILHTKSYDNSRPTADATRDTMVGPSLPTKTWRNGFFCVFQNSLDVQGTKKNSWMCLKAYIHTYMNWHYMYMYVCLSQFKRKVVRTQVNGQFFIYIVQKLKCFIFISTGLGFSTFSWIVTMNKKSVLQREARKTIQTFS